MFFNVFLLAFFESLAPKGAVNTLTDATDKTIGKLTYPNEYLGSPSIIHPVEALVIKPGRAIKKPILDEVPTAR